MTSSNGSIFRITGPLWGEYTGHRWIPLSKTSDAGLWCFLWSAPEQTVEKTIETPLIWDTVALIMTSLYWTAWFVGHCGTVGGRAIHTFPCLLTLPFYFRRASLVHTHTHTHIYIYIYIIEHPKNARLALCCTSVLWYDLAPPSYPQTLKYS